MKSLLLAATALFNAHYTTISGAARVVDGDTVIVAFPSFLVVGLIVDQKRRQRRFWAAINGLFAPHGPISGGLFALTLALFRFAFVEKFDYLAW